MKYVRLSGLFGSRHLKLGYVDPSGASRRRFASVVVSLLLPERLRSCEGL